LKDGRKLYLPSSLPLRVSLETTDVEIITGITSTSSSTATALPTPYSRPANVVLYISSAITFASSCDDPGAVTRTMSKIFITFMTMVTNTTPRTGPSRGNVTKRNVCHSFAPSTRAASSTSRGNAASPAPITTTANPAHIQQNAPMMAGVTKLGPSQSTP
jgi:hypothetical protein